MYDELISKLRELASIPEHCENVADCGKCTKEEICLSFTNKRIIEVATQAADAIEELSCENESLAKSVNEASWILRKRWIPVTERLPEDLKFVLAVEDGTVFTAHCEHYYGEEEVYVEWHDTMYYPVSPTHWMPLPEPPKEETE